MVRRKSNAEIKNVAHRARWQPEDDLKLGSFFLRTLKNLDLLYNNVLVKNVDKWFIKINQVNLLIRAINLHSLCFNLDYSF